MAQGILKDTQMRLIFETGLNEHGEPVLKSKNYNNVKKDATVDQVFQVAQALAGLSSYTLNSVERNDSFDIIA